MEAGSLVIVFGRGHPDAAAAPLPRGYRRREPEKTVLHARRPRKSVLSVHQGLMPGPAHEHLLDEQDPPPNPNIANLGVQVVDARMGHPAVVGGAIPVE